MTRAAEHGLTDALERWATLLSWGAIAAYLLAFGAFTNRHLDAFQPLLFNAAVLLAVAVSSLRFAAGQPLRLPAGWCWLAAALYAFWGMASKSWAERPQFLSGAAYLQLQAFFLFLLLPQVVPDRQRLVRLARLALGVSALLAVAALIARLAGGAHSAMGFAYPTGNPNLTTLILEPGMMLAVGFAWVGWVRERRVWTALALAALAPHLAILLLNHSMAGLMAVGAGGLALWWALAPRWRGRCLAVALLGAVLLGLLLTRPPALVSGSVQLRRALWQQAWGLYTSDRKTVLVGRGLGNYLPAAIPYRVPAYFRQREQTSISPHPHNLFLRVGCELGAVGLVLLLALLFSLAARARQLLGQEEDEILIAYGAVGLASLVSLLLHAQLSSLLDHPLGTFLFWGWAGVLAAAPEQPEEREPARPLTGLAVGVPPLLLLGAAYFLFAVRPFLGRLDVAGARQLRKRVATAPGVPERRELYRLEADYLERAVGRLTVETERGTIRAESAHSLAARDRWGQAAFLSGARKKALEIWLELELVCPGYGQNRWRVASAAMAQEVPDPLLANRFYLAFFAQDPTEPGAYAEWWTHRELLGKERWVIQRVVDALERGAAWTGSGKRHQALVDLRAQFELLLAR